LIAARQANGAIIKGITEAVIKRQTVGHQLHMEFKNIHRQPLLLIFNFLMMTFA
jgi:hypothetical protein